MRYLLKHTNAFKYGLLVLVLYLMFGNANTGLLWVTYTRLASGENVGYPQGYTTIVILCDVSLCIQVQSTMDHNVLLAETKGCAIQGRRKAENI